VSDGPEHSCPLRLLRVAEAVARGGSAAAAADELHLSPSAISRAVAQAEARLGLPLFERGARGMAATPAGEALLKRVARALAQLGLAGGPLLAGRATDAMLAALAAVAEQRSETAAARTLGLSQAAVHQSLRQLEHAARQPLVQRSHRGSRLTEAGERMLLRAKLALAELRTGHDELAALAGRAGGRVAVGALPMACDVLVPQALSRLAKALPGVQVTLVDGTYEALVHRLRHGDVDLVVGPLRGVHAPGDVAEETLFVDRLLPVVRLGHPLASGRGRARTLADLLALPWIGPLPGTPARAAFERVFAAAGLALPPLALQTHSTPVLRALLQAGDAVALLSPWQVHGELAAGRLLALPVPLQGTERAIGLMQRRDGLASSAVERLLAALRAVAGRGTPS
jgi:LysR family transcriptional regulator, regulator for genes of the gallate degradation pathway